MQKRIFILCIAVCWFSAVSGQQARVWSFQQCVDTAMKRNININQSLLSNEVNKINLAQSKANRIPNLNAAAGEGVNFGRTIDPVSNQYVEQTYNSTNFSVTSSLNLFNGFQNTRTIRQNMMLLNAGKFDVEKAKNDVILDITTGYLQVLFAYEVLKAAKNQSDATTADAERTQKLVNAGKVPESNLFTIRAQLATDNLAVVNAQNQLDLAKVTLMQLMQVPVADSFDIQQPVMPDPDAQLILSNEQIYQKALVVQPQITSASIRTNSALLGIKIYEGARLPRLSLSGNVNTNFAGSSRSGSVNSNKQAFFPQLWNNMGEGLGLNLSIPIYTNRALKSNIERARVNALSAQLDEENTKIQLRKIIEQAYSDLRSSIKKFEATKEQVSASELSYRNVERKFNVGLSTAIDFLIEKNNFFKSQSNLIQARYDYIFKAKILDFYQGKQITL
jgi:outer membrane protein